MSTKAKKAFDANIQRATYFLDIHEETQPGVGAPTKARKELPRGALVFAIGALDAYLSEVSAEIIVARMQQVGAPGEMREVLRRVQNEIPTLSLEVALLQTKKEREDRVREAITDYFFNTTSHHGTKAVAAVLGRLGRSTSDLWSTLGSRGHANAAQRLDAWTERRHEIVHQGRKPAVVRNDARKLIQLLQAVVDVVEEYLED